MTISLAILVGLALGRGGPPAVQAPAGQKVPPQLAKARLDAARQAYEGYWRRLRSDRGGDPEKCYSWSRRWMEAQQALGAGKAAEQAAQAHLERMKELEKLLAALARTGQGTQADADAAQYYRVEAEIWLSQVKGK